MNQDRPLSCNAPLYPNLAPIAVGGVGGSGTRVVAQILSTAGIYMGDDLNIAHDNLWFTLLFKRQDILKATDEEFRNCVSIFVRAMTRRHPLTPAQKKFLETLSEMDRPQHPTEWLRERKAAILASGALPSFSRPWGWKEPNTHIVIDRLFSQMPRMKYIHVARNGLDMAYSRNQNQLRFWGKPVFGTNQDITPRNALKFWCWVHERILRIGRRMGKQFLLLRFEDLCHDPAANVRRILKFAGLKSDPDTISRAVSQVRSPETIGRHLSESLDSFDAAHISFVRELGFAVGTSAGRG